MDRTKWCACSTYRNTHEVRYGLAEWGNERESKYMEN